MFAAAARAVVVYESMFGNTRKVAEAIGADCVRSTTSKSRRLVQ
jgi:flavodoxin